jgi:hypothetical protein
MDEETAQKWVLLITDAYNRGMNQDEVDEGLRTLGICEDDAYYLRSMVDLGYQRAVSYQMGITNISSNYESDLIFQESLRHYSQAFDEATQKKAAQENDNSL